MRVNRQNEGAFMLTRRHLVAGAAGAAGLACLPAFAGKASAGADWSEDIRLLRRIYTELHPGLYRYATPAAVSERFQRLERFFGAATSLGGAYLELSRFLATVQCGHTYANFYNQSETVVEQLFSGRTRLPFHFQWFGQRMVVTANHSGKAALAPGAEVLSVDGRPAAKILKALMPYARADGGNDAKRRALLSVTGDDAFETFDIFQGLAFPPKDGAFTLTVRVAPGEKAMTVRVDAIDLALRRTAMAPAAQNENAPQWTLDWHDGRAGVLTMPGWALYDSTWDWRAFLDGVFAGLDQRRATGLVVDLRGNEGGLDCGHEIVARLIDRELVLDGGDRKVRYRKVPDDLNPYLDTWDNSFRDWGDAAVSADDGWLTLKKFDDDARGEVIAPKGPRFAGKVAVLIDAQNSSATFQFARIVQDNRLATLIGEPTGGNRRGINGGAFFFVRLPKSGIEADLPLIGYFPKTPQTDEGLAPDVFASPSIDDVREGRDSVREKALAFVAA